MLVGVGALAFLFFMSRLLRKRETDEFAGTPTWLRELEMPRSLSELEAQTQMVDLDAPTMVARLRAARERAQAAGRGARGPGPRAGRPQIRQWMTED